MSKKTSISAENPDVKPARELEVEWGTVTEQSADGTSEIVIVKIAPGRSVTKDANERDEHKGVIGRHTARPDQNCGYFRPVPVCGRVSHRPAGSQLWVFSAGPGLRPY